jgi:hypothetical protein
VTRKGDDDHRKVEIRKPVEQRRKRTTVRPFARSEKLSRPQSRVAWLANAHPSARSAN